MSSELDGLCCPLTLEVFEDPCTLVGDGHTYERSSIQAWLDSGKLTSPTTGATLGIGGTRLVPNYAVKRTIAELAARGRLPPKGTSPRLATEVSQLAAAAEVLTVAEEPLPPPPPSDPRITAQFSEGGQGFSDKTQTARQGGGFSEKAQSASQGRQGFSDRNKTVRGGAKFGMGKVVDSSKDKMYVGQFQESGHVVSDKSQSFSEGSGRTWFGWGKKKERKAGPRGRALEAVEQKQEESSDEDEPLEHACDALLVGGALRGGGSLAADGAFGTLTADGTSRPVYHALKSNARTDAKVLKLCAPPLNAGMVLTCGQTRGVSAFRWKDYEVTATKESSKWWKKAKATTSRKRCWEKSGELKGSRDWGLCLASDARGSYAVAGCRGGDLKLWRPVRKSNCGRPTPSTRGLLDGVEVHKGLRDYLAHC